MSVQISLYVLMWTVSGACYLIVFLITIIQYVTKKTFELHYVQRSSYYKKTLNTIEGMK